VTADAVRFGDPRIPAETITDKSHLFRLSAVAPTLYDGGFLQQAHEDNFPILKGQEASIQMITL
jgi:oxalate decarboxylase